jgi:hypothetical protein
MHLDRATPRCSTSEDGRMFDRRRDDLVAMSCAQAPTGWPLFIPCRLM